MKFISGVEEMLRKVITSFPLNLIMLIICLLSVVSVFYLREGRATGNDPIVVLVLSIGLIGASSFIRRRLRR